jgi:NDP-sugar pyrophosphorylase family protein
MRLAIIAAGESSRMFGDGITVPKSLIEIGGVPIIGRVLQAAIRNGVREICCVVNPRFKELEDYLTSSPLCEYCRMTVVKQETPSSMHSLFILAPFLTSGPFCLATADTVFLQKDYDAYIAAARKCKSDGMLALTNCIHDERPLCVTCDKDMRITDLSDSPEGCEWASGGLYYMSPRVFDAMSTALGQGIGRMRNFLRLLLRRGYDLHGFPFGTMIDVDHASDLRMAESLLARECGDNRG